MNENDIKRIVNEALDLKLAPIIKDVDTIKVKLSNHIEHFAYQFTEVKNDVSWLKKLFDPEKMAKNDATGQSDISWLKWGVRLVLAGIIAEAIGIAIHILGS